ncbi:MAG: hypothetical protein M3P98_04210 [bacterium]|nr:hypothetical protein [bacterium]
MSIHVSKDQDVFTLDEQLAHDLDYVTCSVKLIRAAPDLLEAAKRLESALQAYSDFNCGIVTRKRKSDHAMEILAGRDSLSRAIAKAEGVK